MPVRGHEGPHGAACRGCRRSSSPPPFTRQAEVDQSVTQNMNEAQLRAHIAGLQPSLNDLQAAQQSGESSTQANPAETQRQEDPSYQSRVEDLASRLSAGNRVQSQAVAAGSQWTGPNISDLRSNADVTQVADRLLELVLQRAPSLQQHASAQPQPTHGGVRFSLPGQNSGVLPPGGVPGQTHGAGNLQQTGAGHQQQQHVTQGGSGQHMPIPGVYQNATMLNTIGNTKLYHEHYPHLYVNDSSITQANINMPLYILGYLRFLMSVVQGKQTISADEFEFRMQNLVNIVQVSVTNSSRTDYNDQSWAIAREYGNRVLKDLEEGNKSWSSMGLGMQTDAYIFSKDSIKVSSFKANTKLSQLGQPSRVKQTCKNFNTVANEGQSCSWELANPGKRCNRIHACNYCLNTFNKTRDHRSMDCESKKKGNPEDNDPFRNKGSDQE